ncbi:MAG: glycosyltransferase [Ignavibacteriota bacterium]
MIINKPNILIISSRADFGGGPEHIFGLVNNLREYFNFFIAAPTDYPYYAKYCALIGKENFLEIPHRKFRIKYLIRILKFIKLNNINIVHSHGKGAGIYSRLCGFLSKTKAIHTFHGIHLDNYNSIQKSLYLFIERLLAFSTSKFINVSNGENELTLKYHITESDKLTIIENGVELPDIKVSENNFNQDPKTIISFSRFDYAKNSELLMPILSELKELSQIDNFRFLIYGQGPNQNKLKELITANNFANFIHLEGTTNETSKILLSSFCYISTSRWEGLPLGVLEAYAHGLPVIATNVIGNFNVIENNIDGLLFGIDKPKDAAKFLIDLSNNKDMWISFSNKSRLKAEIKYSIKRMANETRDLYIKLLT